MPQFETHFYSSLIFWEIVSFGILLWVMYKYALPPILEILETRERKIRDNIEQAEESRAAAERRLAEYQTKLEGIAKEAEGILGEARHKAQRALEENEQRLRAESDRIKAETSQEIDRERRKALKEIREQTADLAILVAEKVLERTVGDEDHQRLAEEALQAVSATYPNGKPPGSSS